jgi:hypothetical protein|tara:strand:+ start:3673 stop:3786 length:114 start_codon:yes stop_codon:yes gene_type:complete
MNHELLAIYEEGGSKLVFLGVFVAFMRVIFSHFKILM